MQQLLPGIWQAETEGTPIVVNEMARSIGTILPDGKVITVSYTEIPTISDFVRFREQVSEALSALRSRKIHRCESKF